MKNTDILAQKQKYLTDAIDATKKKLQEEKTALEQLGNVGDDVGDSHHEGNITSVTIS